MAVEYKQLINELNFVDSQNSDLFHGGKTALEELCEDIIKWILSYVYNRSVLDLDRNIELYLKKHALDISKDEFQEIKKMIKNPLKQHFKIVK